MSDTPDENNNNNDAATTTTTTHQIRVSFRLAPECQEATHLTVPPEAIAIPSHLQRKGLSAVMNHLLGRQVEDDDEDNDMEQDKENNNEDTMALEFDFLVGGAASSQRLLRTSLEKEVRRAGLSLEEAVVVTYFPATPAPTAQESPGPELPDWISALQSTTTTMSSQPYLVSACYDGSLHVLQPDSNSSNNGAWKPVASSIAAHQGPIKCLSLAYHPSQQSLWMATGAMDNTVSLHEYNNTTTPLTCRATAVHAASVASVSLWPQPIRNGNDGPTLCLASGDWDGGVFLWSHDLNHDSHSPTNDDDQEEVTSHKKRKTGSQTAIDAESTAIQKLSPTVSLQAHNSKVSGVCWGNYEKRLALESSSSTMPEQLITASWDHSIKVWNIERQDCLLTLNSSRVVSCLDTSPHSAGICVTGHPDCTVRLWDVRAATTAVDESMTVSDNVFRPSHQAWISDVQWSSTNPYQVYSSSHDGTVKVWDIRSSLPLYTVRVLPASTGEKVLSLATWETSNNDTTTTNRGYLFAGGTNRVVEQFELKSLKPLS